MTLDLDYDDFTSFQFLEFHKKILHMCVLFMRM